MTITSFNLFRFFSLPQEVKEFVKLYCLHYIGIGTPLIQATLGILISTIAAKGGLHSWPELLPSEYIYLFFPGQIYNSRLLLIGFSLTLGQFS